MTDSGEYVSTRLSKVMRHVGNQERERLLSSVADMRGAKMNQYRWSWSKYFTDQYNQFIYRMGLRMRSWRTRRYWRRVERARATARRSDQYWAERRWERRYGPPNE